MAKLESVIKSMKSLPDANGHFGQYGGKFVAETLMGPLNELEEENNRFNADPDFLFSLRLY